MCSDDTQTSKDMANLEAIDALANEYSTQGWHHIGIKGRDIKGTSLSGLYSQSAQRLLASKVETWRGLEALV